MIVDASALTAMILDEADATQLQQRLEDAASRYTHPLSI